MECNNNIECRKGKSVRELEVKEMNEDMEE